MYPLQSSRAIVLLSVAAAMLSSRSVGAQMTLVSIPDNRTIYADATCGGIEDGPYLKYPLGLPGSFWSDNLEALVEPESGGSASADAGQVSEFLPSGIYASGWCSGQWQVQSGEYSAWSVADFTFRVDNTIGYTFYTSIDPGDSGPPHSQWRILLRDATTGLYYAEAPNGDFTQAGRLPPGTYQLRGETAIFTSLPSVQGPTFAYQWVIQPVVPIIVGQPHDTSIVCGGTLQLAVVPTGSGLTYQWRRNLVPLANGGQIGGATTANLTVSNACAADTGYYDVVVTSGDIVEPSRLAHVTLTSTTAVLPDSPPISNGLTLSGAFPSPMVTTTSFRFAVREPVQASGAIYNAAGRLVRTLEERTLLGTGTIAWDGRETSSAQAPAGVYFLRLNVGGQAHVRRFVRLR